MPIAQTGRAIAEALRQSADIADDAAESGAELTVAGVRAVTSVARHTVAIPTSLLRFIADLAEEGDKHPPAD